jgi:predicted Fe-Mo cluster-binding NifX family protein
MKVAVTSQGPDLTSEVDPRFGRARFFIVIDTDTGDFSTHDNTQNLNAMQGAGIQAARKVSDLEVEAVVTGNVGPKAFSVLQQANVKVCLGATGAVKDAFEQFRSGQLASASEPNVEGHWT